MVVATAQGHGVACARSIRTWVLDFVRGGEASLPFLWLYTRQTVLEDEDLLKEIQEELSEKSRRQASIKAQDVCDIVAGEKILQNLFSRMGILETWHLTVDGTKMACKTEVALQQKRRMGCILTATSGPTLWPIDRRLFIDGRNTKCAIPIFGRQRESPSSSSQIRVPSSISSLSHTMNPRSWKMIEGQPVGIVRRQPASPQTKRRRAIANGLRFLDSGVGTPAR